MRFLAQLRHAYKSTNLTYPHKNSLSYASVLDGSDKSQNSYFVSQARDSWETVPLHLDAFINGNADIHPKKIPQNQVRSLKVPEFNEYVTALAANLCSASSQKGFPTDGCRKYYCTENTFDTDEVQKQKKIREKTKEDGKQLMSSKKTNCDSPSDEIVQDLLGRYDKFRNEITTMVASSTTVTMKNKDKKKNPHIVCIRDDTKGCTSPGLSDNPPFIPKKTSETDGLQATKDGLRLLDSNLYQKSLKEAEIKRKQMEKASANSKTKNCQKTESKPEILRACQSKKTKNSCQNEPGTKDSCKPLPHIESAASKCGHKIVTGQKCANFAGTKSFSKCGSKSEQQTKNHFASQRRYENLLPKSPKSKCSSDESKPTGRSLKIESNDQSKPDDSHSKDPCKLSPSKSKNNAEQKATCGSEKAESKDPSKMPSKASKCSSEQISGSTPVSQETDSKSKCSSHLKPSRHIEPELKDSGKVQQKMSKCTTKPESPQISTKLDTKLSETVSKVTSEKTTEANNRLNLETTLNCGSVESEKISKASKCSQERLPKTAPKKPSQSSKCSSKPESQLNDPCKIPPITKMRSSCSSSGTEDPCKVPPITLKKSADELSCGAKPESSSSKPKCKTNKEDSKALCEKISETNQPSKCSSKCGSSNICNKSQNEASSADSQKACKRAAKIKCSSSSCDSVTKNPCKSSCDSMTKPKAKCGRPPRGDTKPRCKKDSKCGSKQPSPSKPKCSSKEQDASESSKCGTEMPSAPKCESKSEKSSSASKCRSKTCAPSPKASKSEIKHKSTCSSDKTKPKGPLKREFHKLARLITPNIIFTRNFSDDCPKKPKGGYKPESERSDEYRRETCENFSWKANKARKPRTNKPKNCYPEETLEFCPDTACYKVYAETSGKADKKKSKKKPKANKFKDNRALCKARTAATCFKLPKLADSHQKFYFSSQVDSNQEALIEKPHKICTRNILIPKMSNNDVLISVDSVSLSDTDIYMFETGARHTPELTLGNEAAGIVQEVGKNVCDLKAGDHVVLESGIPCGKCDLCKAGRYNLCNNISFKGFLRKCCVHPASFCHKICTDIPLEHAALVPQLALGCNACYQAAIKPHSNVAIIGSCAMTVCAAICALSMGAENVCVMCGMPETRILIEQFVTDKVKCFDNTVMENEIVRMMLASLGTFPDIVINCSGSTKTMNAAIMALKPTGTCVVAGFLSECVSFNIMDALMKEIRMLPSFRSKNMFPVAIHLLESGRVPADCLIANCEPCKWHELECAFKLALSEGNNGPRKSIVKVGD